MLNFIVCNSTVWTFNCVETNDWCLIQLFMIHNNTLNHLPVYKQVMLSRITSVNSSTWNYLTMYLNWINGIRSQYLTMYNQWIELNRIISVK